MTVRPGPALLAALAVSGMAGCRLPDRSCDQPAGADRIAFVMDTTDADQNLYLINPDGSALERLTRNAHANLAPRWSPDRTRIAFLSNREEYFHDLYVMCADGTGQRRLTRVSDEPGGQSAHTPTWSPDGARLAFGATFSDPQIGIANVNDSGLTHLTSGSAPGWSPDGRRIAFGSDRTGTRELYVVNVDGSDPRRLTRIAELGEEYVWAGEPAWSPDGARIVFELHREGNYQIAIVGSDGTGASQLTTDSLDDRRPQWSPDGRWIAFIRDRDAGMDEEWELWVMDADGNNQTQLTSGHCDGYLGFSWSPDSRQLAFARGCQEWNAEGIWIIGGDGSGLRQLVNGPAHSPQWSR